MVESTERNPHFHEYFKVIRNRLWVIFTIFALSVGTGWYVTEQVLPKIYSATAQIEIKPRGIQEVPGFMQNSTDKGFDPTAFQTEFEIMHSSDVLLPIISDLGLDKVWAKRIFKSPSGSVPPLVALGYMNGNVLKIDSKRGTDIIVIMAESEVPQEAADIANAVADHYKTMRDVEEDQRSSRGGDSLRDQIAQQQKVVDADKANVEKLRQALGAIGLDLPAGTQGIETHDDQALASHEHDLLAAQVEADGRRVVLESVQNLGDDEFVNTLEALGSPIGSITTLRSQSLRMESDIENLLKQGFEENHPRVQALRAELDRTRQQIKELIAGTRRALAVDAQMSKSRVELLTQVVNDLKEKTTKDQTAHLAPFRDALQELQRQQSVLDAYSIHLKQTTADRQLMQSPIRIISRAVPADSPSKPDKRLDMAISAAAGLFVGIVIAFLIEYLDTSVKTMADAESLLGLPVLTVIPNKGGPIPLNKLDTQLPHAEGYRILRAKLDLKVQNGIGPSLSMLSGGPGEGKSTTIYNLAIVCAQAGQSVILVDCDLRRPTLHNLLNVSNEQGMANYLHGEGDAVDYIQQTVVPKLHLLAAGEMPMADIGSLAGDKIRAMLDDLKQRYDLVLVDAPPVLGISDGSIIAREVDYVILVIQHRRYPREISLRAKRAIEEVHGNCVGMVLNYVSVKSDDSYYYYSNYGSYYNKKTGRDKKRKDGLKIDSKSLLAMSRKTDLDSEEF